MRCNLGVIAAGSFREMQCFRTGALTYLAAWDVHHAKLFGRCEPKTTIGAVDRLVEQVMTTEPYRSARRVFWIADNYSSHRGDKAARSPPRALAHGDAFHTPVHASWLNQVEIYFSIVQRKIVTPNDFISPRELEERLLAFQVRYEQTAKPFQWAVHPGGSGHPVDQAQDQRDESRRLTGEHVTVTMKHST